MTILLDEKSRVLVQGITGREGIARTRFMLDYGTNVVAGVTPDRGGQKVHGVPVYDTVRIASERHGVFDVSVTFVPGPLVKDAVLETIEAGVKLVVVPAERVPLHDALEMLTHAKNYGARIIGPGSIGLISPGKAAVGWLGGTLEFAKEVFAMGHVGITSRSGSQSSTVAWIVKEAGLGVSTCVCTGSEPLVGTVHAELLELFEKDAETDAVAMFGEIGSVAEEEAAELIAGGGFTKPLVAFIAGAWAREGMRFSHASAIIEHGKGTAQSKVKALEEAGAYVVDRPEKIALTLRRLLRS